MRYPVALIALIALLLAACAVTQPIPPTADATPPDRPPVPAGWVTIASHAGDAELTVPPDLGRFGPDTPVGVRVRAEADGRDPPLQVEAHGAPDQPAPGESIRAWLERATWFPSGEGGTIGDISERELLRPTGRAFELAATVQSGTRDESRVVVYAIETAGGFAVLRIIGAPNVVEARADELRIISLLARFGD